MKNKAEENTPEENNLISKKILNILENTSKQDLEDIKSNKLNYKDSLLKIIENEKSNKKLAILLISEEGIEFFYKFPELHNDVDFLKLALEKDFNIFYALSDSIKSNENIAFCVIQSMIRESKSYLFISNFIEKYYPKDKEKYLKYYNKKLSNISSFYKKDFSLIVSNIKTTNSNFYELLKNLEIINTKGKNISINNKFIYGIIEKLQSFADYENKSDKEKREIKMNILSSILGLEYKDLDDDQKYLFDNILNLLLIEESKISGKKEDKSEENEENKTAEKNSNNSTQEIIETLEDYENFEDFGTYCYPDCEIRNYGSGYLVETAGGKNIQISKSDADNFTTDAFKNFINFYNRLYNIGLNFLWDKYSSDFKTLCTNKVGFNYLNGEGITDAKTLQILNIIGKNIGIPEEEVIDEKGEKTGKYKCFKNTQEAISMYSSINSTGIISGEKYSENGAFGNSAVENKLISDELIDTKKGILNLSKWK